MSKKPRKPANITDLKPARFSRKQLEQYVRQVNAAARLLPKGKRYELQWMPDGKSLMVVPLREDYSS